jgi:hypothetical protein
MLALLLSAAILGACAGGSPEPASGGGQSAD